MAFARVTVLLPQYRCGAKSTDLNVMRGNMSFDRKKRNNNIFITV